MTRERLREICKAMHWSCAVLAKQLEIDPLIVHYWFYNNLEIPEPVAEWLEQRHADDAKVPPPKMKQINRQLGKGWRKKKGLSYAEVETSSRAR